MFITFEGLDGAGKSTQIERLCRRLESAGRKVLSTREPGGTAVGDEIRRLLLDPDQKTLSERAEALLYAASRAQLIAEVIEPALQAGNMVVCDRYVDASLAYQGAGLGLGVEAVAAVNAFGTRGLRPDLTFLMDLPVQASHVRVHESRGHVPPDRIERRSMDYFSRVRAEFLRIAESETDRVIVLDATHTADALEQEIWRSVANRM